MAGLKLRHIYKVYPGGVRAVNDFNLDIKDRSFVVLVGPSGCGKSTTLRMVAGLESITSGQLYIDNNLVNDLESKDRDIAMVFQSYALYPHMTVYQNMGLGLKLRHEKPEIIKEKVTKAAEILEISDLLDRKPKELSGGQRQRVALGRAIVREPNVFLLDEPLSNLDAKLRVQMRTEITKLHEKLQTTFLYVTHDQTEAMTMGDTIVVMNKGFIQQADAPVTLFEDPANLFVATFLGSPQMNIVPCSLREKDGKLAVLLENNPDNAVLLREETAKQIKANHVDIDKEYLFGIRPDHIVLGEEGIAAEIEVIEQLGDETILHCKIADHAKNIVVKMPLEMGVKPHEKVHLSFRNERVYLFDKDTEYSLIGMPSFNRLPCHVSKDGLALGKLALKPDAAFYERLAEEAYIGEKDLVIRPEHVSFNEEKGNLPLEVVVDFIEERTNYDSVFAKVDGLEEYLIFRAKKERKIQKGERLTIYLPEDKIRIFDEESNCLSLREVAYPNVAACKVKKDKNGKTIVMIENGESLLFDDLDVPEGAYRLTLRQRGFEVLFDKKTAKSLDLPYIAPEKGKFLSVSCYDEEPSQTVNFIYAQIKGFPEYVTLEAPNNFSVYKMPSFKIKIHPEDLLFEAVGE